MWNSTDTTTRLPILSDFGCSPTPLWYEEQTLWLASLRYVIVQMSQISACVECVCGRVGSWNRGDQLSLLICTCKEITHTHMVMRAVYLHPTLEPLSRF